MSEKTVIQRYLTALGDQDWAALEKLYAPDVTMYAPTVWGVTGVEFLLKFCQEIHRAHPGIRAVLHDEFFSADGTRAAFRFALHWHNTGPYFGNAPTGERGSSIEQHTVRIEGGRIVEQVVGVSTLGLHFLQKEAWGVAYVTDAVDPAPEIVSAPPGGEPTVTEPLVEHPWSIEAAAGLRVPGDVAERFRERGWWRNTSVLHDLLRVAAERPDDPAIVVYSAQEGRTTTVRYAELAFHVRRFSAALTSLGVRRGDRVAFQLPNWWEVAALTLACCWTGAIAVPLLPTLRALELERMLEAARAQVCVVVDTWEGYDCVAALEEIAPRLPWLRHGVVHGERVPPWAVDFREYFLRTPHEERLAPPRLPTGEALDRVCMLLFTSGTTGERKAVLHTENTLYAGTGAGASTVERGWAAREVFSTPHPVTGPAGLLYCVWGPILAGGTGAYQDVWAPERYLELLSAASVTQTFLAPSFVQQLLEEQRQRPRSLPSLRFVMTGAAPVRADLARAIHDELRVLVRSCWGMTEAGMGFRTREDDPCDWAAKSDGSPMPGLEMRLLPGPGDDGIHRLLVRGASLAVGFWQPGSGEPFHETWSRDDGWLDTGDLVREDGRGGIRFAGRASRRVGATFMIPVAEVEQEILRHPGVREVVIVGYEEEPGHESSCAVVVADGDRCPTLAELVGILVERGMTRWYLPTRLLEVSPELPRNENGKIRYERLKAMIVDSAGQLASDRDERRP